MESSGCEFNLSCDPNNGARMPNETQNGIKDVMNIFGQQFSLDQQYFYDVEYIFDSWTNENIENKVMKTISVLSKLAGPLSQIIPDLEGVINGILLGLGGFLQVLAEVGDAGFSQLSYNLLLSNLTQYWNLILSETEDGIIFAKSLNLGNPFLDLIISKFPLYGDRPLSTSCHTNYNNLLGNIGNVFRPRSQNELKTFLKNNTKKVVPISEISHTFNDSIETNQSSDAYISTKYLDKIINVDTCKNTVRAEAGVPLHVLYSTLAQYGKALENSGNWDNLTVGGAVSTGVHGSNSQKADSFSDACIEIVGYTSMGTKKIIKKNHKDFNEVACSFGKLLIITEVALKIVDRYDVRTQIINVGNSSQYNVMSWTDQIKTEPLTELDWFPIIDGFYVRKRTIETSNTQVNALKPIQDKLTGLIRDLLVRTADSIFLFPGFPSEQQPRYLFQQQLVSASVSESESLLPWNQGLMTNYSFGRSVPQVLQNQEYCFDFTNDAKIIEIINKVNSIKSLIPLPYSTTFRTQGCSDHTMINHFGRRSLYFDIGYFTQHVTNEELKIFEDAMISIGGRPHWGKWLCMDNREVYGLYPIRNVLEFKFTASKYDVEKKLKNNFYDRVFDRADITNRELASYINQLQNDDDDTDNEM
jgi:hypothetical protein